ncbi:MAG: hypothetical protein ACI80H_001732, partial [Pseudoalteromonas distincta]
RLPWQKKNKPRQTKPNRLHSTDEKPYNSFLFSDTFHVKHLWSN